MTVRQFALSALLAALIPSFAAAAPLLQWTFDEASGNALDTGDAPANDGVLTGGAVRSSNTPSGFGSSVDLRNDSPYAHVLGGDADKLDGLTAVTVSTWVNLETYTGNNARLFSKQASAGGGINFSLNGTTNDGGAALSSASDFRVGLFLGNNNGFGASDFGVVFSGVDVNAENKWVFLAGTYDGTAASNNAQLYIGGINTPVTPLGAAATLPQLTIESLGARFGVGFTDAAPGVDTSPVGLLDDARVYGSALTLADLETVRLQGAIPEPGALSLAALGLASLLFRRRC